MLVLEKEIPKRFHSDVVAANYITLNPKERFVLALTRNLKLLELKCCEINNGIDLSNSILKGLSLSACIQKSASSSTKQTSIENEKNSLQDSNMQNSCTIGKYILQKGSLKRFFILLKVYTKLVILERVQEEYKIIHEYENVEHFEIVDSENNFQPLVAIQFSDKPFYIETDFTNSENKQKDHIETNQKNMELFKNLLERIKNARTELSIHKIKTEKEFVQFKSRLMFGPNLIRPSKLEEKQPLGKYGDVWMRVVNDQLVIGIPIINNCSERLISLQNIRIAIICEERNEINFEYSLYQLKDDSYTFENFDELLQNEEELSRKLCFNDEWLPIQTRTLHPETSGIILLKTKLDNFISSTSYIDYICFILYDITFKHYTFAQQHFLKKIHIETDIIFREDYLVKMDLSANSYMDLLAITATSSFANFQITFNDTDNDFLKEFKEFVSTKLEFKYLTRNQSECSVVNMDVDPEPCEVNVSNLVKTITSARNDNDDSYELFFNDSKTLNFWYGSLFRFKILNKNTMNLKVYFRSEQKIFAFIKILYENLKSNFKVIPTCYSSEQLLKSLRHLENCLRKELNLVTRFCKENEKKKMKRNEVFEFQKQLFAQELETDIAALGLSDI